MKNNIIASLLAVTIFSVTSSYAAQSAAPANSTAAKLRCAFEAACQKNSPALAIVTDSTGDEPELPPGMVKLMGEPGQEPANPDQNIQDRDALNKAIEVLTRRRDMLPEAVGKSVPPKPIKTINDNQATNTPSDPSKTLKQYPIRGMAIGLFTGLVLGVLTVFVPIIVSASLFAILALGGIGLLIGNHLAIDKMAFDIFHPDKKDSDTLPKSKPEEKPKGK